MADGRLAQVSPDPRQFLLYLKRAVVTPAECLPTYPTSVSGPDMQTAYKHLLLRCNTEDYLLVGDVLASIDKGKDDIAQC